MKRTVPALLLCLTTFAASASGYQDEIDKFFGLYEEGRIEESVDQLYSSNPYVSAVPDQVKQVKSQLRSLEGLVGGLDLKTKLSEYSVGDVFVHVTYLLNYDRQAVRFEFQFFKIKSGWRIDSFSFDTDFDDEVEALARREALQREE
ncbi:MAG: hypothetical protein CMP06_00560 [Xanthomonadales bacterium]|nr:hypothetical protein [Xanthomonadales bacterium]